MTNTGESFYPLYDNGRSLFYEDTEETVGQAVADPERYATTFGYTGTYWDYVKEIAGERGGLDGLIDFSISKDDVMAILREAGFTGYRLTGAAEWIFAAIEMIKSCGRLQ
jgi:hypothetical protein